jgi:hypothetical protein
MEPIKRPFNKTGVGNEVAKIPVVERFGSE